MASSKDIRNRIKGVKSTRQITRAMQMVATSKMKKAQDSASQGDPMLCCFQTSLFQLRTSSKNNSFLFHSKANQA